MSGPDSTSSETTSSETTVPFYICDVFAERSYAGNQLAVVLPSGPMTTEAMQAVASEMNYSETTFVDPGGPVGGAWPVRIFTPSEELPFAGHPTLGTASIIRRFVDRTAGRRVVLSLGVGEVPVEFEGSESDASGFLHPEAPDLLAAAPRSDVAALLGLDVTDVDPSAPCLVVRAGIGFVLVPLLSADAVARATLAGGPWSEFRSGFPEPPTGVYFFTRETTGSDCTLHSRMLFDAGGIREDPATGSATACLGAWLSATGYLGSSSVDIAVEQGIEMGRPSVLHLRASPSGERQVGDGPSSPEQGGFPRSSGVNIQVGGRVIVTARGELLGG